MSPQTLRTAMRSAFILAGMVICDGPCDGAEPQVLVWQNLQKGAEPPAGQPRWQRSLNPDGTWSVLDIIPRSQAEKGSLLLPAGRVRWAGVFPANLGTSAGRALQLIGDISLEPPSVEEVSPLKQPPPLLPVPPGVNMAAHLGWSPFGVEERVASTIPESDISPWIVKAGKSPAGVYSSRPWRFPQAGASGSWSLEMHLRGRGTIQIGVSGDSGAGFGDPVTLGTIELKAGEPPVRATRSIPSRLTSMKQLRLTLLPVGTAAAEIQVETLIWQLHRTKSGDASAQEPLKLGVWDWSTNPAQWERLRPLWKKAGITVLQLALPRSLGEGPDGVAPHLQSLQDEGFEVVAVEGDPHMILPQAREPVLSRHADLLRWRDRFVDGIQYDVEPYLLPGFRLGADQWHQRWLELYQALSAEGSRIVEPVVPFWLLTQKPAQPLLGGLAGRSARMVIMNYRSDPAEAAAWATAWLEWSLQHACPVAIAVECGPVADLESATFRRGETGTLWMSPWPGHGTAVALFDTEVTPPPGSVAFLLAREGAVPGSATSLKGRPHEDVAAQLQILREVCSRMALPASLSPRLLLHEPEDALVRFLGE